MLGTYLKQYMKNNGIKQSYLSEKTGITQQTLTAILDGQRKMEVAEYYDICAAIGVSPTGIATEAGVYRVAK